MNGFEPDLNNEKEYIPKYVLFIDILGFKNIVFEKKCQYILEVLDAFKTTFEKANIKDLIFSNKNGYLDLEIENGDIKAGPIINNPMISAFSDSIAVSFSDCELFSILQYLMIVQLALIEKNILIRGGLSFGEIYHKDDTVFGKALINSYNVENNLGDYPFIGIDRSLYAKIIEKLPGFEEYFKTTELKEFYFDFLKFQKDNFTCNIKELKENHNQIYNEILTNLLMERDILKTTLNEETSVKSLRKIDCMINSLKENLFSQEEIELSADQFLFKNQ